MLVSTLSERKPIIIRAVFCVSRRVELRLCPSSEGDAVAWFRNVGLPVETITQCFLQGTHLV